MTTKFNSLLSSAVSKTLVPAFTTKNPDKIRVGKVTESGITDIRTIPISEIENQHHFTWTESVIIPDEIKKYVDEKLSKEIKNEDPSIPPIGQFHPDLIICDMGKQMGQGVFLAPGAKKIKKGDFIGYYVGEYKSLTMSNPKDEQFLSYGLGTGPHPLFQDDKDNKIDSGQIDSEKIGNIFRFVQDAPTVDELQQDYQLKPGIIDQVATQNIRAQATTYKGYPLVYFVAERDIEPEEEVVYSYTNHYWIGAELFLKIKRLLTDKKGHLIPPTSYIQKTVPIRLISEHEDKFIYYMLSKIDLMNYLNKKQAFTLKDDGVNYSASLAELQKVFERQFSDNEKDAYEKLFSKVDVMAPKKLIELKQAELKKLANVIEKIQTKANEDKDNSHHVHFATFILFLIHHHKNVLETALLLTQSIAEQSTVNVLNILLKDLKFAEFNELISSSKELNDIYSATVKQYGNNQYCESAYKQLQAFFIVNKNNPILGEFKKDILEHMKTYNEARKARNNQAQAKQSLSSSNYQPKGPLNLGNLQPKTIDKENKSDSKTQHSSLRL